MGAANDVGISVEGLMKIVSQESSAEDGVASGYGTLAVQALAVEKTVELAGIQISSSAENPVE